MTVTAHIRLRSSLSPDSDEFLSPLLLCELLKAHNVRLAALTDINTALNCPAFDFFCKNQGIAPLYGLETWAKDGKALLIFNSLRLAVDFSTKWHRTLPCASRTKTQYFVDEKGAIIASVPKELKSQSSVPLKSLCKTANSLGAIVLKPPPLVAASSPALLKDGIFSLDIGSEELCLGQKINLKAVCAGFEKLEGFQVLH